MKPPTTESDRKVSRTGDHSGVSDCSGMDAREWWANGPRKDVGPTGLERGRWAHRPKESVELTRRNGWREIQSYTSYIQNRPLSKNRKNINVNEMRISRVVESVGENVKEVVEGDTVLPTFMSDCGDCADCKSHKSNLCSKFPFKVSPYMPRYEDSSRFTDLNGNTLFHFLNVSSFSEYTVLDVANVVKIDSSIPPSRACLLSCGVSTGVGAAWETAKVEKGSTVVIFGLGSIGLAVKSQFQVVAEGARLCGASRIIGVDINPAKFQIVSINCSEIHLFVGKKFGVNEFVNSKTCENKRVSEVINEMTCGGADYCFECVGSSSLVQEAYACCRKICLDSFDVLHHGKTLVGSMFGGLKAKTHIPILLKYYLDNELELDKFVTHEMKFEDINDAFQLLIEGKCI
ncbi:hypothetical protein EUTSA_v10028276mg, partial [Eutrema salsugineum]